MFNVILHFINCTFNYLCAPSFSQIFLFEVRRPSLSYYFRLLKMILFDFKRTTRASSLSSCASACLWASFLKNALCSTLDSWSRSQSMIMKMMMIMMVVKKNSAKSMISSLLYCMLTSFVIILARLHFALAKLITIKQFFCFARICGGIIDNMVINALLLD